MKFDEMNEEIACRKDLVFKLYKLMNYLESINEERMSQYELEALGHMILDGEVTLENIGNHGIDPKELMNIK